MNGRPAHARSEALAASAYVFDLDGTLIDSAGDIAAALNHALAGEPTAPVPREVVRGMIGDGVKPLIRKALVYRKIDLDADLQARLYERYQAYARERPVVETLVFPGMTELLARLKRSGARIGVCTNKTAAIADLIVERLPFGASVDVVTGGDGPYPPKPDPSSLLATVRALGCEPERSVYVGDMVVDRRCALAAGVPFVGVDHGHWDKEAAELKSVRPAAGAEGLERRLFERSPS